MVDKEVKQEKPKAPDEDIFVLPDAEIGAWVAQPLSIRGTVRLVRLLAGALTVAAINVGSLVDEDGKLSDAGVTDLLIILDESLITPLFSVITGLSDKEVEETYTIHKAFDVVKAFWEQEDLASLWTKVRGLSRNQEFQERSKTG